MDIYLNKGHVSTHCSAPALENAFNDLYGYALELGFSGAVYVFWDKIRLCPSKGKTSAPSTLGLRYQTGNGQNHEWMELYLLNIAEVDPVYRACQRTTLPVLWGLESRISSLFGTCFAYSDSEMHGFHAGYEHTGVRNGVAVPIRGVHGGFGYVSFLTQSDQPHDDWLNDERSTMLLLQGLNFYERINMHVDPPPSKVSTLSDRELECLTLAAHGATLDMISDDLGIARSTVRYHVENAVEKLDAPNRIQAIAKAARRGIISIEDH